MTRTLILLAIAIILAAWADGVHADPLTSRLTGHTLRDDGKMSIGYEAWRASHAEFTLGQAQLTALPESMLPTLQAVNTSVNHSIRYEPDRGPDHWDVSPATGDCDDYVVTKLTTLVALGVPRSALRIVVSTTRAGTLHLALAADVGVSTVILDNLRDDLVPWDERTDLTYRAVEIVNSYGVAVLATLESK